MEVGHVNKHIRDMLDRYGLHNIIEVCDRSKVISGKTKDVFMGISGARYFKSRKDGATDFTIRLVSNNGIYSWYEGSNEENTRLLQKVSLVLHEHCVPYLAHVQGSKTCKVDMKLCRTNILEVKLPAKQHSTLEKERDDQWKELIEETAKEIQESRKPFEDAIAEKQSKLQLLEDYSRSFSNNKVIHFKNLPSGPYIQHHAWPWERHKPSLERSTSCYWQQTKKEHFNFAILIKKSKGTCEKT